VDCFVKLSGRGRRGGVGGGDVVGEMNEWRETEQWLVYGNPATTSRRRQWQRVMAMEEEEVR
jgi:hypothetical protein